MYKTIVNGLLDTPLLTSLFVMDLAIMLWHKPPFLFAAVMLSYLIGMGMYYGQKFAIFKNV